MVRHLGSKAFAALLAAGVLGGFGSALAQTDAGSPAPAVAPPAAPGAAEGAAQGVTAGGAPPVHWEELTAPEFVSAVARASRTAIVPLGIVEKHGPHLPLGTDLFDARELARRAAAEDYVIVFPPYYFGQIFEAKHQPGTLAYSERLVFELLQETVDEIARNGISKIILVNGHGGNNAFVQLFCQAQLARRRDYAVYVFQPESDPDAAAEVQKLRRTTMDMHAGEVETSTMLAHRPDIVHPERAGDQSGVDQARLGAALPDTYTPIWWYARFPNHYAGDGRPASRELGSAAIAQRVKRLVAMVRAVKADTKVLELQQRFFEESARPLATPQK